MAGGTDFRPAYRLLRPAEFAAVLGSPKRVRSERFELRYGPNDGRSARLGLVMPKRLARRAVLRNLLKRLSREAFRQVRAGLPSLDLVLRLTRSPGADAAIDWQMRQAWRKEIDGLLAGLPR